MQSIREEQKDCFTNSQQSNYLNDLSDNHSGINTYDNDTSDLDEETLVAEFCSFNQILKRHRRRFKLNSNHRHH